LEHVSSEVNKGTKEVIEMEGKTKMQNEKILLDNNKKNIVSRKKRENGCCGAIKKEFIV
jgi:hypothetical protein